MPNLNMLPEWAPCHAVLLAWPYPGGDWDDNYDAVVECYWQMLEAIANHAEVWVLLHPRLDEVDFGRRLVSLGHIGKVRYRSDVLYNDTWIRDYGPISCAEGLATFRFNGWGGKYEASADDAVAFALSDWFGARLRSFELVCEGGALETNSQGVLLANEECVVDHKRNAGKDLDAVQHGLRDAIGLAEFAWLQDVCLTNDDTDGHVDTIARFAADDTVIYSGRNADHHDAPVLEGLHEQIQVLAKRWGWQSFELPSPVVRSEVDSRLLPATYANFLICNDAVLLPVYGVDQDVAAQRIVGRAFPGYQIVPVSCAALLEQHGSLHCATMQIAKQSLSPTN